MNKQLFNLAPEVRYIGNYEQDAKKLSIATWVLRGLSVLIFILIIVFSPDVEHHKQTIKKSLNNTTYKTSFDCSKANSYVEKAICGDKELADLDLKLSSVYKAKLAKSKNKQKQKLQSQQKNWVLNTENACASEACIKEVITARINILNSK